MRIPERTRFINDEDDLQLWWEVSGELLDFSAPGWTYTLKVATVADQDTALFEKTTGFTGAAGSGHEGESIAVPNLVVTWNTTGELNVVTTPGRYVLEIVAVDASGADTTLWMTLNMKKRLGAVPV